MDHHTSHPNISKVFPQLYRLIKQKDISIESLQKINYIQLGKTYLSLLMKDVLIFSIKQTPHDVINQLIKEDFCQFIQFSLIDTPVENLLVKLALVYKQNKAEIIDRIKDQLTTLFDVHWLQFEKYRKNNVSKSFSTYQSSNQSHLSLDLQNEDLNLIDDDAFTSFDFPQIQDTNFKKLKDQQDAQQEDQKYNHIKEVHEFLNGKNANTIINHLEQFKQKVFNIQHIPQKKGASFQHTTQLNFTNFLNQGQLKFYKGFDQGNNQKQAKEKANKILLIQFFTEQSYVFKDFAFTTKLKNLTF